MKTLSIFAILVLSIQLRAQETPEFLAQSIDLKIDSKVYQTERKITVYLPELYFQDTTKEMVVAYVFDGQFKPYYSMVTAAMEYYSQTEEGIPMIVVAIHTEDRWREFIPSPKDTADRNESYGFAHLLSEHLKTEVMPLIESNYRTLPFRLGIGHSLGGTYLLYELFKEHSLFNGAIMASPNMLNDGNALIADGKAFYTAHPGASAFIYVASGNIGDMENDFRAGVEEFDTFIQNNHFQNLDWRYRALVDGTTMNHMNTFPRAFHEGYIAFSNKCLMNDERLVAIATASPADLQGAIKSCLTAQSQFTGKEIMYSVTNLKKVINLLDLNGYRHRIVEVYDLAIALCETDSTLELPKDEMLVKLNKSKTYFSFLDIAERGKKALDAKQFEVASTFYSEACKMGTINGTHVQRLDAIRAFAQTGKKDAAFEQLELLANYYQWQGDDVFLYDSLMEPLKKDKRWAKLMVVFKKNQEAAK